MTASTDTPSGQNTVDRALQSLRVTRQPDEARERETVMATPGSYTDLARSHARSGPLYKS